MAPALLVDFPAGCVSFFLGFRVSAYHPIRMRLANISGSLSPPAFGPSIELNCRTRAGTLFRALSPSREKTGGIFCLLLRLLLLRRMQFSSSAGPRHPLGSEATLGPTRLLS